MARELNKSKLSNSILEMKFMKKSKEKVTKELEDTDGQEMYSHEITPEMRQGAGSFIIEQSFVPCEHLLVGRLSYRGMNPEIERIMELENAELERIAEKQGETEVSDIEMANFYNPLVGTMKSKFNKVDRHMPAPEWKGKHKRVFSSEEIVNEDIHTSNHSGPFHKKNKRGKFLKPKA